MVLRWTSYWNLFLIEQAEQEQKLQRMEAIRDRWQRQLEELIGQISAGFSQFFATMGFAGEVMTETK